MKKSTTSGSLETAHARSKCIAMVAAILLSFSISAQFPYGTLFAAYPQSYRLSSGFKTNVVPGYFWLGYLSSVSPAPGGAFTNKNFFIDGFGNSATSAAYQIFDGCTAQMKQVLTGYGISAIEISSSASSTNFRYALAGAYDKGCWFATINASGAVVSNALYPFSSPVDTLSLPPSQPLITQDPISGDFFIAGTMNSTMYVLRVNAIGNVVASKAYQLAAGLFPSEIMCDPYLPSSLVMVGCVTRSGGDRDGFFMKIDMNALNSVIFRTYGAPQSIDEFLSIAGASYVSANNADGFVVGGNTNVNQGQGNDWVLKLDRSGNIIWNKLIQPSMGSNSGVMKITERLNSLSSYEYFGLMRSAAGMHVIKLDASGNPYPISWPSSLNNEYAYNLPALNPAQPTSLSYVNTPAGSTAVGLQIYGTAYNLPGYSSSYVVMTYFNGQTNCFGSLGIIKNYSEGAPEMEDDIPSVSPGLIQCQNFQILSFTGIGSLNIPCNGILALGSNQRTVNTGVSVSPDENTPFSVFPNPSNGRVKITYTAHEGDEVTITLYDLTGRLLYAAVPDAAAGSAKQGFVFDVSQLNIEDGLYLLNLKAGSEVFQQKILIER